MQGIYARVQKKQNFGQKEGFGKKFRFPLLFTPDSPETTGSSKFVWVIIYQCQKNT